MEIIQTHIVPEGISGIRFREYVFGIFTGIPSRKGIRKAIRRGEFRIDGEVAVTGIWVESGMRIELIRRDRKPRKIFHLDLDVVFEDDHLAVIDKPAGFDVSGNTFRTITNALPANLAVSPEDDVLPAPRTVHRLDNQTRGLLIVAKTARAQMVLGLLFEKKAIRKRYRAIVIGQIPESGRVERPIEKRPAITVYRRTEMFQSLRNEWLSRVDLWPETGRTHQLRKHMKHIGHPILGDKRYGTEGMILKGRGLFLCAVELRFPHPISEEPLQIEIPEPAKFTQILAWEKRRWEREHTCDGSRQMNPDDGGSRPV